MNNENNVKITTEKPQYQKNPDKIGWLYKRITSNGKIYLAGEVEIDDFGSTLEISIFKKGKYDKEGNFHENWPDYDILRRRMPPQKIKEKENQNKDKLTDNNTDEIVKEDDSLF